MAAEAGVAVIAVGAIASYDDVNSILLAGRADLCAVGRTHLYDPQWTLHAAVEQGYRGPAAAWPDQFAAGSRKPPSARTDAVRPQAVAAARGGQRTGARPVDAFAHGGRPECGTLVSVATTDNTTTRLGQLILTIFALYGRTEGNWLSVASIVALMADLGADGQAVRSSVSRLKRRGVLDGERRGAMAGYSPHRAHPGGSRRGRRADLRAAPGRPRRTAGWWWCSRSPSPSATSGTRCAPA